MRRPCDASYAVGGGDMGSNALVDLVFDVFRRVRDKDGRGDHASGHLASVALQCWEEL